MIVTIIANIGEHLHYDLAELKESLNLPDCINLHIIQLFLIETFLQCLLLLFLCFIFCIVFTVVILIGHFIFIYLNLFVWVELLDSKVSLNLRLTITVDSQLLAHSLLRLFYCFAFVRLHLVSLARQDLVRVKNRSTVFSEEYLPIHLVEDSILARHENFGQLILISSDSKKVSRRNFD